jgi:uncharacterized membrane protein
MANDVTDILRQQLGRALQEAVGGQQKNDKKGGIGSGKGLLTGAALAAAAPMARRGIEAYRSGQLDDFVSKLGTGQALEDVRSRLDGGDGSRDEDEDQRRHDQDEPRQEAGAGRQQDDDDREDDGGGEDEQREPGDGTLAVGEKRRMPVQQSVDVGVALESVYNQFTQFEDWPQFMHRVINVSQDDDETIRFTTKIWGKTKEFEAKILTQRPDDRIMWKVSQGITHAGIVSFHELAPRLTRIEVTLDVKPGSLIEKAARGMRHVKRAVRADLHRFKAFMEMQELETGAWRGVILDGEVVEPHDESYDEERDYSDIEDLKEEASGDEDEQRDEQEDEPEDDEEVTQERPRERARRRTPAAA